MTLEFHQNDASNEVQMIECRFQMPLADENEDPALSLCERVLEKADVIQAKGSAITQLFKVQCLTPRGRYDVRIYPTFLHLHGKTFDFKLTYTSIIRLFLLPHKGTLPALGQPNFKIISRSSPGFLCDLCGSADQAGKFPIPVHYLPLRQGQHL